ncbi:Conserved hypothetical protein [Shewanella piezotolerans WP3]|uniref:DUF3306 domain-containing protein n=1 Tax=Shewanella piezotolerans (strain WP3 / JCM 13877) TaxID=225849 RepID=B8CVH1_SHEPW|nr:DUF3306 domain-containing protein [Shewanella piezotolerans]ACJ31647.1 Conserved hypothetical protein [Shewanella piezotolerans WP3]
MSGLLSRWNLRRQKVEQEAEADFEALDATEVQVETEEVIDTATVEADGTSVDTVESNEDKLLTAEDLPDPEKIEVGGSFASFMGANVDPAAKSAALKALWKQPHYSEIDGLLEYALDYSNQPKLSADVSAELAKKVFRHVVKDKDDEEENEEALALESDEMTSTEEAVQAEVVSDTESVSDILDGEDEHLSQNEPEHQDVTNKKVV